MKYKKWSIKKEAAVFFLMTLLLFSGKNVFADQVGINNLTPEVITNLDKVVSEYMDPLDYVRLGVVYKGEVVFTKVYAKKGSADGSGLPVSDSLSKTGHWASISKPATAMIVMQLLREGKIRSLDDNIWDYAPKYKNCMPTKYGDGSLGNNDSLTFKNLLTHQSGLPYLGPPTWSNGKLILKFKPGTRASYSSVGFGTLANVIKSATGKTFNVLIDEYLNKPISASIKARELNDSVSEDLKSDWQNPNVFVYSTIEDMAKFSAGILNNTYVSGDVMRNQMLKVYNNPPMLSNADDYEYGLGWCPYTENGKLFSFHTGSVGYEKGVVVYNIEDKMNITIQMGSTNYDIADNLRLPFAKKLLTVISSDPDPLVSNTCAKETCVGNSCWNSITGKYIPGTKTTNCASGQAKATPISITPISDSPPKEVAWLTWSANNASRVDMACVGPTVVPRKTFFLNNVDWYSSNNSFPYAKAANDGYPVWFRVGTSGKEVCTFYPINKIDNQPGTPFSVSIEVKIRAGVPTCGTAVGNYDSEEIKKWNDGTWPLCKDGTPEPASLSAPTQSIPTVWKCKNGASYSSECKATYSGSSCGTAIGYYNNTTIKKWNDGTWSYCKIGNPNPTTLTAPFKGNPTIWKCKGTTGLETQCKAFYDNTAPTGNISATSCTITGKVTDIDKPNTALSLDIYKDQLKEGNFILRFPTKSDGTFSYTLSNVKESEKQFFDGKEHLIVIHAIGIMADGKSDNLNPALTGSPVKIRCGVDYANCKPDNPSCAQNTCKDVSCFDGCNYLKGLKDCVGRR